MSTPQTPSDVYKAIIDQFVQETRLLGSSSHVTEYGIFSKAPDHREFNSFIESLSEHQRSLLSRMLQDERDGAIHDLLAALSWWIVCRGVGLTVQGEEMPIDLSGAGLHGDFIGRRDGWDWPTPGGPGY